MGCHGAKIKTVTRLPSAVRFVHLQTFLEQDLLRGSSTKQGTLGFRSKKNTSLFEGKSDTNRTSLTKPDKR